MKKIFKVFTFLSVLLSACLLASCELLESLPGLGALGGNGGTGGQVEIPGGGEFDTAEQLSQIY